MSQLKFSIERFGPSEGESIMQCIRIWADTHSTGLIDQRGAPIERATVRVSEELWQELQQWVRDYDYVIPLGTADRLAIVSEIEELDTRGLQLLDKLAAEWEFNVDDIVRLEYFSEGRQVTIAVREISLRPRP